VEDPDLALRLDPAEGRLAERQTVGFLEQVDAGPWQPLSMANGKSLYGGVILAGLFVRELTAGTGATAELLGAGEVILPRDADDTVRFVAPEVSWTALEPSRIAWLDAPFGLALRRWPQLAAALLERTQRRVERLALSQAISQLTRVDDRVLILLWHLGERWGRVRPDGILVPLRLTHRVIARLIGARRPSVTTAVGKLERDGALARMEDGAWLLRGRPPAMLGDLAPPAPWRHGRGNAPALSFVPQHAVPEVDRTSAFLARADNARRRSQALKSTSELLIERARSRQPGG
jgi:CRP/FNR family cyclic AMP-dependent transcriptional regulator